MELTSTLNELLLRSGQERAFLHALADKARLQARVSELERANQELESASRAKSESLAVISHELRTPLLGLIGLTDLLLNTDVNEDQRECLETMQSSGRALLRLLNDLLEYSKLEAGAVGSEPVQFPLRTTIHGVVQPLKYMASRKGVPLAYSVDFDVPDWITGDSARLSQVLVNLIGNAVKFTNSGEIQVIVERLDSDDREVCLEFTVADTGIGISPDKIGRIFDPYYQIGQAANRPAEGTGLGLAIATRLVELMGGRIWVESEPDKGSRFHFTGQFGLVEPMSRVEQPLAWRSAAS
jgi:two-component system, sensor histidine kinase and response regulator